VRMGTRHTPATRPMLRRASDGGVEIPPSGPHTHTVILLHGCYCNGADFAMLPQLMAELAGRDAAAGVKFIFPSAPLRTLHWPEGTEDAVSAWYDYFTSRANTMFHDEIDLEHLASASEQMTAIVNDEISRLGGDTSRVVIGGNSQGGTLAGHVALSFGKRLGALIFMRSCLLDVTPVEIANTRSGRLGRRNAQAAPPPRHSTFTSPLSPRPPHSSNPRQPYLPHRHG